MELTELTRRAEEWVGKEVAQQQRRHRSAEGLAAVPERLALPMTVLS